MGIMSWMDEHVFHTDGDQTEKHVADGSNGFGHAESSGGDYGCSFDANVYSNSRSADLGGGMTAEGSVTAGDVGLDIGQFHPLGDKSDPSSVSYGVDMHAAAYDAQGGVHDRQQNGLALGSSGPSIGGGAVVGKDGAHGGFGEDLGAARLVSTESDRQETLQLSAGFGDASHEANSVQDGFGLDWGKNANGDGKREFGGSAGIGPVAFDYKTEHPVTDTAGLAAEQVPVVGLLASEGEKGLDWGMNKVGLGDYSPGSLLQKGDNLVQDWFG